MPPAVQRPGLRTSRPDPLQAAHAWNQVPLPWERALVMGLAVAVGGVLASASEFGIVALIVTCRLMPYRVELFENR